MKEWINEEAVLTVDVGTGWISRYEAEGLAAGSIVRSSAEAGNPCIVRVNGGFFAQGSVAVVDGAGEPPTALLGAFLESFDEPENVFPRPARGDEAIELLPFALRLNAVRLPFSSLEGAGIMSFVNLDRCADGGTDAELILAGIAVAEGKVVVIGENMGLRVTRLLFESPRGNFPRTTGSVLSALYNAESVKNYNFRMPDCFTKRAIQRTQEIHLEFLRGYESRFPGSGGWKLDLVDQLNYGEWLDDGARPHPRLPEGENFQSSEKIPHRVALCPSPADGRGTRRYPQLGRGAA
jgi:flagellar motor switch/type III secretory pathway protein FliN